MCYLASCVIRVTGKSPEVLMRIVFCKVLAGAYFLFAVVKGLYTLRNGKSVFNTNFCKICFKFIFEIRNSPLGFNSS